MFFLGTAHLVTYLLIPAMLVIGLYFDVDADTQAETLLVDSPMYGNMDGSCLPLSRNFPVEAEDRPEKGQEKQDVPEVPEVRPPVHRTDPMHPAAGRPVRALRAPPSLQ